jgi:hypothetical protein
LSEASQKALLKRLKKNQARRDDLAARGDQARRSTFYLKVFPRTRTRPEDSSPPEKTRPEDSSPPEETRKPEDSSPPEE